MRTATGLQEAARQNEAGRKATGHKARVKQRLESRAHLTSVSFVMGEMRGVP